MRTISLKLPDSLHVKLDRVAKQQRKTKSDVIRDVFERFLNGRGSLPPASFLEAAADLIGCVEGPGDLSTNPKQMEGFGK